MKALCISIFTMFFLNCYSQNVEYKSFNTNHSLKMYSTAPKFTTKHTPTNFRKRRGNTSGIPKDMSMNSFDNQPQVKFTRKHFSIGASFTNQKSVQIEVSKCCGFFFANYGRGEIVRNEDGVYIKIPEFNHFSFKKHLKSR